LWSDYLCPWCYLGRATTRLIRELDLEVRIRPYELHPNLPPAGKPIRGERSAVYRHIATECEQIGMPFRIPDHIPNSRLALETASIVAHDHPHLFAAVDDALFEAYFVAGQSLADPAVVNSILEAAGLPVKTITESVAAGRGTAEIERSMSDARSLGITAVPSWWIDDVFLLPGVQDPASVTRWVTKLRDKNHTS